MFRYKLFPRDAIHYIQDALIEYIPGTDLLLDHIEACLFDFTLVHDVALLVDFLRTPRVRGLP